MLLRSPRQPASGAYYAAIALGIWLVATPTLFGMHGVLADSERLMGMIVLMMILVVSGRF